MLFYGTHVAVFFLIISSTPKFLEGKLTYHKLDIL